MQFVADLCKISIGAETAVNLSEVTGVVAVAVGFKNRREVHRIAADRRNMSRPVTDLANAIYGLSIILPRRPTKTHWINLIKNTLISPHNSKPPCYGKCISYDRNSIPYLVRMNNKNAQNNPLFFVYLSCILWIFMLK